ncbi:MAG: phosphatase PAP2 family protein [Alphaproteobacteria bacterium]
MTGSALVQIIKIIYWESLMLHRIFALPLLLALIACGGPYPYPPQYVAPSKVDARSIPVPDAPYSKKWNDEIDHIIALQKTITPGTIEQIRVETAVVPQMIAEPVLGKSFTPEAYPVTYEFLAKVGSDAWRIGDDVKEYWGTTRPWLMDSRVQLYAKPIYSKAYPSGHTVTNYVWAEILSELFPSKREAFFARAAEVAEHRIIGGAHTPDDVMGGQKLAAVIVEKMRQEPEYQKALAAARAEIKKHPIPRSH